MDHSIINFAVYEDGKEHLGVAKATLPDVSFLSNTISGAGIAGNVEEVIIGHIDAMELGLNFLATTPQTVSLSEPRKHQIDLRIAQQGEDTPNAEIKTTKVKHVFVIVPKSDKAGSIAPASASDASGSYAVHYWATYIDGAKVRELDPLNYICYINGTDYLQDVRKALGK